MVSCKNCSEHNPCSDCKDARVVSAWLAVQQDTPEEPLDDPGLVQGTIQIHPGCGRPIMECEC
jgi:hypothetical protein